MEYTDSHISGQETTSEYFLEIFNKSDLPVKDRDSKATFVKYFHLDGEWIEEGAILCEISLMLDIDSDDFPAGSIKIESLFTSLKIKSTRSGILELTLEQDDIINDGSVLCKIHPKGQYSTRNTPEKFEYKEFFKESDHNRLFDRWLIDDGAYVKVGDPIFHFNDYNNGRQTHINYSKKEGYIHLNNLKSGALVGLITNELMYTIRDSDEKRIQKRFLNNPDIITDEFNNSTIIKWRSVSGWDPGINTTADGHNVDLIFSFNYLNGGDHITFYFNPKQIRPKKFDQVQFLFENEKQIQFELSKNSIQSKNFMDENILEYQSILTKTELDLFASTNFKKWKISLDSDGKDILGGEIANENTYYKSKHNIQIAIKKFANDYIDLVNRTIPNYQPLEFKQIMEINESPVDFCFVYLMHDTSNDYYKIGISQNPEYRESTLQSEKPTIELIASKKLPIRKLAESIERALHDTYSEKRIRGEWFNLNLKDVQHIRETLR